MTYYLEGATCLHDHWFLQRDLGGLGGDGLSTLVRINNLEVFIWCFIAMLGCRYFWVMKSYISTESYDPYDWHANINPSWYLYHPQLMKSWSDARYSSAVKNCKVAGKVAADLLNWLVQQQLVGRCCLKHNFWRWFCEWYSVHLGRNPHHWLFVGRSRGRLRWQILRPTSL